METFCGNVPISAIQKVIFGSQVKFYGEKRRQKRTFYLQYCAEQSYHSFWARIACNCLSTSGQMDLALDFRCLNWKAFERGLKRGWTGWSWKPNQAKPSCDSMKSVCLWCAIAKYSYLYPVMKNDVGIERAINLRKVETSFKPSIFIRIWIPYHNEVWHSLSQGTMLIQCSKGT